eukprot:1739395-Rhodomonas_salina.1
MIRDPVGIASHNMLCAPRQQATQCMECAQYQYYQCPAPCAIRSMDSGSQDSAKSCDLSHDHSRSRTR